jgi:hypothetical protein
MLNVMLSSGVRRSQAKTSGANCRKQDILIATGHPAFRVPVFSTCHECAYTFEAASEYVFRASIVQCLSGCRHFRSRCRFTTTQPAWAVIKCSL